MDIESYREYCLSKAHVTEDFPFDEDVLVFRLSGKIFSLCNVSSFESVNLKCDPEKAVELREQNDFILPGWHMNKKHWNTILLDARLTDRFLKELIDHSYDRIAHSLSAKMRKELGL